MSQALYRKWRPQQWKDVVGQEHIIQTLLNAVAADRVAHAYLFPGPRGTGKTSTARLLAKAVNCLNPDLASRPCNECANCLAVNQGRFLDLIEIDAASNTSVDDVRDLRDKINFSPNLGAFKVYIIDEVHMLSTAAFNALLKTLEEPPPHAIFILATTEVHKIPATVLSRCQRHEFRRIPRAEIVAQLKIISEEEKIKSEDEVLELVARQATGSMRDAISLLDQLASSGDIITFNMAQEILGTATNQMVLEIVDALLAAHPSVGFDYIQAALDAGTDPRQLARQIVDYLRDLLMVRIGNASSIDTTNEVRARMGEHAQAFTTTKILSTIRAFNKAAAETYAGWLPSLPLELAFVEALESGAQINTLDASLNIVKEQLPLQERRQPLPVKKSSVPPPPEPPEQSANTDGLSLRQVKEKWRTVMGEVRKQNPSTQGLLNSCNLVELRGHDLFLGFAGEILRSRMEKDESVKITQDALQKVFGVPLRIRCVISTDVHQGVPPEVDSEGMVAAALRLGGEIVDSREIEPRKKEQ